jgi:cytochrome P450
MFTARNLREDMSAIFLKNSVLILNRLKRHSVDQRPFDIQDLYFRYTLDSFAEVAFGETAGCLSDGAPLPFATAFDQVQQHTAGRFYNPIWRFKRLFNLGSERVIRKQMRVIAQYGMGVIQRLRHARETDKSEKPDLVSRFIEYAEANGERIDNEELLDVVLNFIIAGRDTTACLLSWATYELTQHPELQERLYAEVRNFSTEQDGNRAVHDLPLLHAFIMETLRLHPPVPQDAKECVEADVWPAHTLPNGVHVVSQVTGECLCASLLSLLPLTGRCCFVSVFIFLSPSIMFRRVR